MRRKETIEKKLEELKKELYVTENGEEYYHINIGEKINILKWVLNR